MAYKFSGQHFVEEPSECFMAETCNHTWISECGKGANDLDMIQFDDECQRHEYNCDNEKDYEKTEMMKCDIKVTTEITTTTVPTTSVSTTTDSTTTTTKSTTTSTELKTTTESTTNTTELTTTTAEPTQSTLNTTITTTFISTDISLSTNILTTEHNCSRSTELSIAIPTTTTTTGTPTTTKNTISFSSRDGRAIFTLSELIYKVTRRAARAL